MRRKGRASAYSILNPETSFDESIARLVEKLIIPDRSRTGFPKL